MWNTNIFPIDEWLIHFSFFSEHEVNNWMVDWTEYLRGCGWRGSSNQFPLMTETTLNTILELLYFISQLVRITWCSNIVNILSKFPHIFHTVVQCLDERKISIDVSLNSKGRRETYFENLSVIRCCEHGNGCSRWRGSCCWNNIHRSDRNNSRIQNGAGGEHLRFEMCQACNAVYLEILNVADERMNMVCS